MKSVWFPVDGVTNKISDIDLGNGVQGLLGTTSNSEDKDTMGAIFPDGLGNQAALNNRGHRTKPFQDGRASKDRVVNSGSD
jgi:hypothetical protein